MADPANVGSMTVSMLTGGPVMRAAPAADLLQVADALVEASVGALIVGAGAGATGILSARDVAVALAPRRDPAPPPAGRPCHRSPPARS